MLCPLATLSNTSVILPKSFYQRPTVEVAKDLLGKFLVREVEDGSVRKGMIVETEAYLGPEDLACHSSKGRTERTEVMFGPAGHAYIYLVYGMHYMFNIVTKAPGEAVLVRALQPLSVDSELNSEITKAPEDPRIAAGPGKLTAWLAVDKNLNSCDLVQKDKLWVEAGCKMNFEIEKGKRIGVDYAKEWAEKPLRFYIENNPAVSKVS
ncbi:MAG: DNA-3-methyladenine glycosylase [Patescibacteria group bacterium]